MVVCCDCAVDVEVEGAEMASAVADAGVVVLWGLGCGVDDGGHALVEDLSFHLVVNVGISAQRWWVSGAGSRGEAGVVAAVVR